MNPRERLYRGFEVKFDDDAEDGTFEGYGAVFGNVDAYGDVIKAGAFKETLRDWKREKRLPPMLVQHGGWGIGDMDGLAIGKWTAMSEDKQGLHVEGRLINLDTERGRTIYGAMREGVLDGLSIGFKAKEFEMGTKPEEPRRTLKKIELVELSVVQMPANGAARIEAVKSLENLTPEQLRDLEAALRDEGLSRSDAVKAVSGFRSWLRRDAGAPTTAPRDEGAADELADLLRRNIATLNAKG